jgi:hypothetical protein
MASGFMQRFKGKISAISLVMVSPNGQMFQSVQTNIAAVNPGAQGTATPLTAMACFIPTIPAGGSGVLLPLAVPGMELSVINQHATLALNAYPQSGQTINALSANTAISVVAQTITMFYCGIAGSWWTK